MVDMRERASDASDSEGTMFSTNEIATLGAFETQRRFQLLRVIVPSLLILLLLTLPLAILNFVNTHGVDSLIESGIGVVACIGTFWATRTKHINVAATLLFVGIIGVIIFLLLSDGLLQGVEDPATLIEFTLFIIPIAVAGLVINPRAVLITTGATSAFTLLYFFLLPHSPSLQTLLSTAGGPAFIIVPVVLQITAGILIYVATRGFLQVQHELGDMRIAYAREKELDRLKNQFITSVNHELRTPIMALQGYITLAIELAARRDMARQERLLARGEEAVKHLAGLVESVLSVKRLEGSANPMKTTNFTLRPVIISAANLLDPRDAAQKDRPLRIVIPEQMAVSADEDRVRQVLVNLLSNACKYSAAGSPIEIAARWQPLEDGKRRAVTQPMIEILVRDYGLGIPPEQAPLLFQRFVRLERDIASTVVGAGLGLAICRSYVETMGGQMWVKSTGIPGEGSAFHFTLPAARG
jgi:signal transduction histidine kinase